MSSAVHIVCGPDDSGAIVYDMPAPHPHNPDDDKKLVANDRYMPIAGYSPERSDYRLAALPTSVEQLMDTSVPMDAIFAVYGGDIGIPMLGLFADDELFGMVDQYMFRFCNN